MTTRGLLLSGLLLLPAAVAAQSAAGQRPPREAAIASGPSAANCVLRGHVLDALTGLPLRNVLMSVSPSRADGDAREGREALTGPDGRWEMNGLTPGMYRVRAYKSTHVAMASAFSEGPLVALTSTRPERTVETTLMPGGVIAGRVVDADGEPVPRQPVMAVPATREERVSGWQPVFTDDHGAFRVFGLRPAAYVLVSMTRATPVGRKASRAQSQVMTFYPGVVRAEDAERLQVTAGGEISGLVLTLQTARAVSARGRVIVSADRLQAAQVGFMPKGSATYAEELVREPGGAPVAADGTFELRSLQSGDYIVSVRAELHNGQIEMGELSVSVGEEPLDGLVIATHGPARVRGRVVADGGAKRPNLSLARVVVEPVNNGRLVGVREYPIGDNGSFEAEAFSSPVRLFVDNLGGTWRLKAVRWKGDNVMRSGLPIAGAEVVEDVELVIEPLNSHLRGVISNAEDATKKGARIVVLLMHDDAHASDLHLTATIIADENSFTSSRPLAAGQYLAVAVVEPELSKVTSVFLESLREKATAVTLGVNESKSLSLALVTSY